MMFSLVIPVAVLIIGVIFSPAIVAGVMIAFEIVFSLLLNREVTQLK